MEFLSDLLSSSDLKEPVWQVFHIFMPNIDSKW